MANEKNYCTSGVLERILGLLTVRALPPELQRSNVKIQTVGDSTANCCLFRKGLMFRKVLLQNTVGAVKAGTLNLLGISISDNPLGGGDGEPSRFNDQDDE